MFTWDKPTFNIFDVSNGFCLLHSVENLAAKMFCETKQQNKHDDIQAPFPWGVVWISRGIFLEERLTQRACSGFCRSELFWLLLCVMSHTTNSAQCSQQNKPRKASNCQLVQSLTWLTGLWWGPRASWRWILIKLSPAVREGSVVDPLICLGSAERLTWYEKVSCFCKLLKIHFWSVCSKEGYSKFYSQCALFSRREDLGASGKRRVNTDISVCVMAAEHAMGSFSA